MKKPSIYMMSNKKNGTIYTGVTSNLIRRIYIHKDKLNKGFTSNIIATYWFSTSYIIVWKKLSIEKSKLKQAQEQRK